MYVPRRGLIVGIVTEGSNPINASNKTELDAWILSENAPNTWVYETGPLRDDGVEGQSEFGIGRDHYVIIDLQTMTVDSIQVGETAALARFDVLLPPPPG